MIVGVIGNLQPDKPEFPEYLDRFRKNSLFRGIRYGNLWGYSLSQQVENPVFIDGMKRLAAADLVLDSANPDLKLLQAIVRLSDRVPERASSSTTCPPWSLLRANALSTKNCWPNWSSAAAFI
ncbi:MAG: hypothetical protein R3C56_25540 [Pirellulaceae bacterium]